MPFFLIIFNFFSCKEDMSLDMNLLLHATPLSISLLDSFANKYSYYDDDYKNISTRKLFDPPLVLNIEKPYRVYSQIKTIQMGSKIADVLFRGNYSGFFRRCQTKYRNMYIYYYYKFKEEDWKFIVILSEHTSEILYVNKR
jgi:hypothetical protein